MPAIHICKHEAKLAEKQHRLQALPHKGYNHAKRGFRLSQKTAIQTTYTGATTVVDEYDDQHEHSRWSTIERSYQH